MPEGLNSIAEDIMVDCLDDILHKLENVGFNPVPLFSGAYIFIGDGILHRTDLRRYGASHRTASGLKGPEGSSKTKGAFHSNLWYSMEKHSDKK